MDMRVGLAQCGFPADGDVSAQVERLAGLAASRGVELLVFPEDLMSPHPLTAPELRSIAEPLDGPFVRALGESASRHGLWMAFTCYETDGTGGAPYNVAAVVDDAGTLRAVYRKCHLYDAHGVLESERTQAGSQLAATVDAPWGRLGLGICYDLRFPEHARAAALAGCQVLLYPSAWHDGAEKAAHWETLLRARAIENEAYVVGVCKAGERYVGRSLVADPLGRVLVRAGHDGRGSVAARGVETPEKAEALLVCDLDLAAVEAARDAMPLLAHRRTDLY